MILAEKAVGIELSPNIRKVGNLAKIEEQLNELNNSEETVRQLNIYE